MSFDREPVLSIEREAPALVREVRQYAREISSRIESGQGIWFAGDVGTGKTTLAMLISKTAMERDHTVAIYSLPRLLSMLRATYDEASRHSLLDLTDMLCSVDLLHIDDVGAEQTTAWVLEQLYNIVNTRYEDGRPLVLTTNLIASADIPITDPRTGQALRDPVTNEIRTDPRDAPLRQQIGDRTVSRIYEICGIPHLLYGDDRRPLPDVNPPTTHASSQGLRDDPQRSWLRDDDDAFWEGAAGSPYGRRSGGSLD